MFIVLVDEFDVNEYNFVFLIKVGYFFFGVLVFWVMLIFFRL